MFKLKFKISQENLFEEGKKEKEKGLIDNKKHLYVFGGLKEDYECSNEIRHLEYDKNAWSAKVVNTIGNKPLGRYGHEICYVPSIHSIAMYGGKYETNRDGKEEKIGLT